LKEFAVSDGKVNLSVDQTVDFSRPGTDSVDEKHIALGRSEHMTSDRRGFTRPLPRLTPLQERFAREYARSGNAKRSAVLAGYSVRCSKQIGSVLLKKPQVQHALKAHGGMMSTVPKTGLTQMWAIQQLVQEMADPDPRIRLAAKKAVLQALTAIGAEIGELECPKCAQEAADLNGLSPDERLLRRLGTTVEELRRMAQSEFEEWERSRRAPLVEAFKVAKRVWGERDGQPPGRDRGSDPPSCPST
jgi:terminase small subunit-like protein